MAARVDGNVMEMATAPFLVRQSLWIFMSSGEDSGFIFNAEDEECRNNLL
jgi:hypothetical protein